MPQGIQTGAGYSTADAIVDTPEKPLEDVSKLAEQLSKKYDELPTKHSQAEAASANSQKPIPFSNDELEKLAKEHEGNRLNEIFSKFFDWSGRLLKPDDGLRDKASPPPPQDDKSSGNSPQTAT